MKKYFVWSLLGITIIGTITWLGFRSQSSSEALSTSQQEASSVARQETSDILQQELSEAFVEDLDATADATIKGEVWADNWFALYVSGKLVAEDSVSISTERSFNAETFTFPVTYPAQLAFVVKDFKENDSGLEYIGKRNQQMGDGGLIGQFTDVDTGKIVAVTNDQMVCEVIHFAPTDKSCEQEANPVAGSGACDFKSSDEMDGWKELGYDDSAWIPATVYTEAEVSPKDGYDEINWDPSAKLIWGDDLEQVNTLLCRVLVEAPK